MALEITPIEASPGRSQASTPSPTKKPSGRHRGFCPCYPPFLHFRPNLRQMLAPLGFEMLVTGSNIDENGVAQFHVFANEGYKLTCPDRRSSDHFRHIWPVTLSRFVGPKGLDSAAGLLVRTCHGRQWPVFQYRMRRSKNMIPRNARRLPILSGGPIGMAADACGHNRDAARSLHWRYRTDWVPP